MYAVLLFSYPSQVLSTSPALSVSALMGEPGQLAICYLQVASQSPSRPPERWNTCQEIQANQSLRCILSISWGEWGKLPICPTLAPEY